MTSEALADALRRIATTDHAEDLSALAAEIQRANPGDPEAALVARNALLKRKRIVGEN